MQTSRDRAKQSHVSIHPQHAHVHAHVHTGSRLGQHMRLLLLSKPGKRLNSASLIKESLQIVPLDGAAGIICSLKI